jgi:hypothetical protein
MALKSPNLKLTDHASLRMKERAITPNAVDIAMSYGREIHTRGGTFYVVGNREVGRTAKRSHVDISRFRGIHVLCSRDGSVVTIYRCFNLRKLRPKFKSRSYRYFDPNRKKAALASGLLNWVEVFVLRHG